MKDEQVMPRGTERRPGWLEQRGQGCSGQREVARGKGWGLVSVLGVCFVQRAMRGKRTQVCKVWYLWDSQQTIQYTVPNNVLKDVVEGLSLENSWRRQSTYAEDIAGCQVCRT